MLITARCAATYRKGAQLQIIDKNSGDYLLTVTPIEMQTGDLFAIRSEDAQILAIYRPALDEVIWIRTHELVQLTIDNRETLPEAAKEMIDVDLSRLSP